MNGRRLTHAELTHKGDTLTDEEVERYFDCLNPLKEHEWWEHVLQPFELNGKPVSILVRDGTYQIAYMLSRAGYMEMHDDHKTDVTQAYARLTEKGRLYIGMKIL